MPYLGNHYSFSGRFVSDANAKGPIADDGLTEFLRFLRGACEDCGGAFVE